MAVFVRKLLRIGKLPDDLRAELDAEGLVHLDEYVPVTRRFSGAVPGLRSGGSIARYVGAVAFTSQRVLGTLSSVPNFAGRVIDLRCDAMHHGAGQTEITSEGMKVDVDLSGVHPHFHGHLSLNDKIALL